MRRLWVLLFSSVMLAAAAARLAAAPAVEDPLAADPRLSQRVQLHVEGQALDEVLAILSRETGVKLSAEPYVADDKIVLAGPPRPLREILRDVAALFNNSWQRTRARGGSPSYLLVRPREARAYEDRLAHGMFGAVMARLDEQVAALRDAPRQVAARSDRDPIRRFLEMPDGRLATRLYGALSPQQRMSFLLQGRLFVPFRALPPAFQPEVRAAFARQLDAQNAAAPSPTVVTGDPQAEAPGDLPEVVVVPVPRQNEQAQNLDDDGLRFHVRFVFGSLVPQIGLGQRSNLPISQVPLPPPPVAPHGDPYTRAPVPDTATLPDPKLVAELAKPGPDRGWVDQLLQLSAKSGLPVVADYYRSPPTPITPENLQVEADPRVAALDAFCRPQGYLWWVSGKTLLLRKRDWYYQRRFEVPDRWRQTLARRMAERKGRATTGDVLLLQALTTSQLAGLRDDRKSAAVYDEYDYAGLPELLALLRDTLREPNAILNPQQSVPLPENPGYQEALARIARLENEITITGPDLTAPRQALIRAFLEAMPYSVTSKGASRFTYNLTAADLAGQGNPDANPLTLFIRWRFDNGDQSMIRILLPRALPEDRRSRTVVATVPGA